jgi:hypothetical protein
MKPTFAYKVKILSLPFFSSLICGNIFYKVATGEIGHHETWRIVASVGGFAISTALFLIALVWLNKKQS